MSLPEWAPYLATAREDARRAGEGPAPALRAALDAWLRDAVAAALESVPGSGARNNALNAAAFDLGRLVGAGELGEDAARDLLVEAGIATGLHRREALATARSGLRAGAKKPVKLPDLDAAPGRAPLRPVARSAPPPEPAPVRLPADAVARLWGAAWPVFTEARTRRWFVARGLDGVRTAALDLGRALAPGASCPEWARCGRRTWATAWPLLLPCFDAAGELVALRARWTATTWKGDDDGRGEWAERRPEDGKGAKEVSPVGSGACRGTVYACPVGRWLLRRGPDARPGDLVDGLPTPTTWSGSVVVVEGGPAWLRYAAAPPLEDAVLGLWAGAWPDAQIGRDLAARIPDGARVVLAPDANPTGEGYADAVTATFRGRAVDLRRLPPPTTGGDDGARP